MTAIKHPYKSVRTKRITLAHLKQKFPERVNIERLALVFSFVHYLATTSNQVEPVIKSRKQWTDIFPWLTEREIKDCFDKLVSIGMLERTTDDGKASGYVPRFYEEDPDGERPTTRTVTGRDPDGERPGCNSDVLLESSRIETRETDLFPEQKVLPATTQGEREILHYMKHTLTDKSTFRFDYEKHLDYIRELSVDFPGIDILEVLKDLRAWNLGQSASKQTKERGWLNRIRNFMKNAQRFNRNKTGEQQEPPGEDQFLDWENRPAWMRDDE